MANGCDLPGFAGIFGGNNVLKALFFRVLRHSCAKGGDAGAVLYQFPFFLRDYCEEVIEGLLAGNGDDVRQRQRLRPARGRVVAAVGIEGVNGIVLAEDFGEIRASAGSGDEGDVRLAGVPMGKQRFAVVRCGRGNVRRLR